MSWTYDDAIVLFNQAQGAAPSTAPTFVESDKDVVGFLGSFGSLGAADPVCADFDADGDDDLLLLDSEVASFTILPGVEFSPAPGRVSLLDLDLGFFVLWESKQEAELQITYAHPQSPLAGATDLEFTVWRQPEDSQLLESNALQLEYHELDENAQPSSFKITIPGASLELNDTYVLEARLVQRVSGTVVAAGPTWSGSFRPSRQLLLGTAGGEPARDRSHSGLRRAAGRRRSHLPGQRSRFGPRSRRLPARGFGHHSAARAPPPRRRAPGPSARRLAVTKRKTNQANASPAPGQGPALGGLSPVQETRAGGPPRSSARGRSGRAPSPCPRRPFARAHP